MKRIFQTAAITALFGFMLAGCEKSASPCLNICTDDIIVNSEANTITIDYSIDNPGADAVVLATPDAEWVNTDVEQNFISLTIEESFLNENRSCILKVSYYDDVRNIKIIQEGKEGLVFAIEAINIADTEITYSVTPSVQDSTYITLFVEKEYFDSFPNDEECFKDDIIYFKKKAIQNNMEFDEYLTTILKKGTTETTVDRLNPGTEFTAYAYGLNTKAVRTSDIYSIVIKTDDIHTSEITFDITTNVTGAEADITIKPSDDKVRYIYGTIDDNPVYSEGPSLADIYQKYIENYIDLNMSQGKTFEESLNEITYFGPHIAHCSLEENHKYIAFAMGVNEDGYINSDIVRTFFQTGYVGESENIITISVAETSPHKVKLSITATTSESYYVTALPKSQEEGKTDIELLDYLATLSDLDYVVSNGNSEISLGSLYEDTDYVAVAFGYSAGKVNTKIFKTEFATKPAGPDEAIARLKADKYYNMSELGELYPELDGDGVIIPVETEIKGDVTDYYYNVFRHDMSDRNLYPDNVIIEMLEYNSIHNEASYLLKTDYGIATIVCVGKNSKGEYGPVFRKTFNLTTTGASPIDTFDPGN